MILRPWIGSLASAGRRRPSVATGSLKIDAPSSEPPRNGRPKNARRRDEPTRLDLLPAVARPGPAHVDRHVAREGLSGTPPDVLGLAGDALPEEVHRRGRVVGGEARHHVAGGTVAPERDEVAAVPLRDLRPAALEVEVRGAGQIGVPEIGGRRGGRGVDRELRPGRERRAVETLDAERPQHRVTGVLLTVRIVGVLPRPVGLIEAMVRVVRLDGALLVDVEDTARRPSGLDPHAAAVGGADRLRELCDLPGREASRSGVRVRPGVEDRLVRVAQVLEPGDQAVLVEGVAEVRREQGDLGVAVVEHERPARQARVHALHRDVRPHETQRRAAVGGRDVRDRGTRLQRGGLGCGGNEQRGGDGEQGWA